MAEQGADRSSRASAADMHRTYVGHVERGENQVTLETLCRLAAGLDVTPSSDSLPVSVDRWPPRLSDTRAASLPSTLRSHRSSVELTVVVESATFSIVADQSSRSPRRVRSPVLSNSTLCS